jgi:hypothetical protein
MPEHWLMLRDRRRRRIVFSISDLIAPKFSTRWAGKAHRAARHSFSPDQ